MLTLAFQIGLTPAVFWDLTPHEFNCALKGYNNETKRWQHMLAWLQANVMNCWMPRGKRITIRKLLGSHEFAQGTSKEQIDRYYREKRERFGRVG